MNYHLPILLTGMICVCTVLSTASLLVKERRRGPP